MTIQIDHGIALPPPDRGHGGRKPIYPWREMQIGDSFLFPKRMNPSKASSYARMAAKNTNRKFTTRKIGDRVRCWRIA